MAIKCWKVEVPLNLIHPIHWIKNKWGILHSIQDDNITSFSTKLRNLATLQILHFVNSTFTILKMSKPFGTSNCPDMSILDFKINFWSLPMWPGWKVCVVISKRNIHTKHIFGTLPNERLKTIHSIGFLLIEKLWCQLVPMNILHKPNVSRRLLCHPHSLCFLGWVTFF